ncbi:MAG: hypothetical protein AAGF31_08880 [Planctomycetota bacterium]
MFTHEPSRAEQVEQLLRNARLRDELEPLYDESIGRVGAGHMTTDSENDFLESMLEWERAPMLRIRDWFEPRLTVPSPGQLEDQQISDVLAHVIHRLFEKSIVLDFTNHLDDRELYTLIYRDILPSYEKKIDRRGGFLHWDCANTNGAPETWLRYYATEDEREMWEEETGGDLPAREAPPYDRQLPQAPL